MKNVAIMVMASSKEPSIRNLEAIQDTIVKYYNDHKEKFKNNFDFYFYWGNEDLDDTDENITPSDCYENFYYVEVKENDLIYRTFEKTIKAFDCITKRKKYDWYVRINISMFLNLDLLDAAIELFNPGCVYGNALNSFVNLNCLYCNDLYVRGDLIIFDNNIMEGILNMALKYLYSDENLNVRDGIDHVDDCLIGACIIDYLGEDYYKHLYMLSYSYLPSHIISDDIKLKKYHIGTRVKTVPPNETYSGYSWDDNEYRKFDCEKMKKLCESLESSDFDYSNLKLKDILVEKNSSRPTIFINPTNQNVFNVFYKFLEQKRKVAK